MRVKYNIRRKNNNLFQQNNKHNFSSLYKIVIIQLKIVNPNLLQIDYHNFIHFILSYTSVVHLNAISTATVINKKYNKITVSFLLI